MRAAGDGYLGIGQPEVVRPTALHQGDRLDGLARRAIEGDRIRIARPGDQVALYVRHGHYPVVLRLNDWAARHFNQHSWATSGIVFWVGVHGFSFWVRRFESSKVRRF